MVSPAGLVTDEHTLVREAAKGDRAAMKAIYDELSGRMYNLISYWLDDELAAEDVLQIVFIKVFRALPSFRQDSSLSTWIYRIALNECNNHVKRSSGRYAPLEAILGSDREVASDPAPDERHALREKQEIVRQAVITLPPKLRAVVVMRYNEGLSYEEISQILGCSTGTVASRLSRALSRLDERLRPLRSIL